MNWLLIKNQTRGDTMAMKEKYSWIIALLKSLKNNLFVLGGAALTYLLNNSVEWVPEEYGYMVQVFGGIMGYMIKNGWDFKRRNG